MTTARRRRNVAMSGRPDGRPKGARVSAASRTGCCARAGSPTTLIATATRMARGDEGTSIGGPGAPARTACGTAERSLRDLDVLGLAHCTQPDERLLRARPAAAHLSGRDRSAKALLVWRIDGIHRALHRRPALVPSTTVDAHGPGHPAGTGSGSGRPRPRPTHKGELAVTPVSTSQPRQHIVADGVEQALGGSAPAART